MAQAKWVKKLISNREWSQHHSKNTSYCFLNQTGEGVWIGFLVVDNIPEGCEDLSNNFAELEKINTYRKLNNVAPRPFDDD